MRKAIAISLVSLVLLAGAAGVRAQNNAVVKVDEGANRGVIHAKVGQTISLVLPAQFGTGYSWSAGGDSKNQPILQAKEDAGPLGDPKLQPGGTEAQRFQFAAVKPGTVVLHYAYTQPWMHDAKPAKEFVVTIIVDKNQEPPK